MEFGVRDIYLEKKNRGSGVGQREASNWYSGLTESWPACLGALESTLLLELHHLPRRPGLYVFSQLTHQMWATPDWA